MWTISLGKADARDGYHYIRNTLANLVSKNHACLRYMLSGLQGVSVRMSDWFLLQGSVHF